MVYSDQSRLNAVTVLIQDFPSGGKKEKKKRGEKGWEGENRGKSTSISDITKTLRNGMTRGQKKGGKGKRGGGKKDEPPPSYHIFQPSMGEAGRKKDQGRGGGGKKEKRRYQGYITNLTQ